MKKTVLIIMVCCLLGFGGSALAKDYLYVATQNALQVIDCSTDAVIATVPAYNAYIINNAYSEDGKTFYLNDWKNIYAIDVKTHKLVATYPFFSDLNRVIVGGFSVSTDNKYLLLSCDITKKRLNIPRLNVLPPQLVVYDMKKREVAKSIELPSYAALIVTLRNDPNTVFAVGLDIYKVNISTGEVTKAFGLLNPEEGQEPKNFLPIWNTTSPKDHGILTGPYYTPTKMGFLLIDRNEGKISTVDADSIELLYSTVLSPDKKYIYGVMDEVFKWDAATGKTEKKTELTEGTNYDITTTSDGKKVYVGPSGNSLTVLDANTLKELGVIYLHGDGAQMTRFTY
jgi:DNA-binding beta-propeller fold protein YncE